MTNKKLKPNPKMQVWIDARKRQRIDPLERPHPEIASRVFRALGMRIVDARKSKYYAGALGHLERAKKCYERAGLETEWESRGDVLLRASFVSPLQGWPYAQGARAKWHDLGGRGLDRPGGCLAPRSR